MIIQRTSPFSGKVNVMDIDVTEDMLERWYHGELIQNAMPHLTPEEREFIMTGITEVEWETELGVGIDEG